MRGQRESFAHLVEFVGELIVGGVDGYDERDVRAVLEVADHGECVLDPPGIHQHHSAQGPNEAGVPRLRGAEQVQHQVRVQGDPTEVRGGLDGDRVRIRDRAHKGGLTRSTTAGDDDFRRWSCCHGRTVLGTGLRSEPRWRGIKQLP